MTLDTSFIDDIKKKLLAEKARIEDELSAMSRKDPEGDYESSFPDYGSKDDENAQEVSTYVTRLSVGETLENELKDIEKALVMIEGDSYGVCKYCKIPIDERRLQARPTSTSCVSCKTKLKGNG